MCDKCKHTSQQSSVKKFRRKMCVLAERFKCRFLKPQDNLIQYSFLRKTNKTIASLFSCITFHSKFLLLELKLVHFLQVDGSYLLGICFVGFNSPLIRILSVILPLTLAIIIGIVFLLRSLLTLCHLTNTSTTGVNSHAVNRLKPMILRIGK